MRGKTRWIGRWLLVLLVIACLSACADDTPKSKYIEETPSGPVDTRVSTHGETRPTIADTTDTEDVEYYNPNTGTTSDYELEVDRDSDGTIQRINFPNSGWLEIDGDVTDNGDGTETYTNSEGVEYRVTKPEKPAGNDSGNEEQ